ncbi:MAG: pyrroline-5-carboxylate reductase [Hydrogenobacter sp.]|uniref:pyrroline-5-carboxylate reductase n=1 Tax=Hydrogenobacter thermophilus TaxID=940 RepID=UPI0030F72050
MRVGIIGYGNMGSSFAKGLKEKALQVIVYDTNEEKMKRAAEEGFGVAKDLKFLVDESKFVLLAVKPKDAMAVLERLKDTLKDKILVSIVAGLSLNSIEKFIGKKKIVRAMPNINVAVQKGAIAYICSPEVKDQEKEEFKDLFSSCGSLYEIGEELIDAFTALAGSGPAFVFKFISALITAGIREGFSYEMSKSIVLDTVLGSCEILKRFEGHPEEWIIKVASPGGTTVEGIKVLEDRAFSGILIECVHKALEKAKKLT